MTLTIQPEPAATIPLEASSIRTRGNIGFSDERRTVPRFRQRMVANVIGLGHDEGQPLVTEDISESGLFVYVPSSYGLRVGQRLEVELQDAADVAGPRSALCGERRYATVVRTEPLKRGPRQLVGAGLCFDQPLFI